MKNYSFSNKVILRTPLKEVDTDITWDKVLAIFQNTLFREALFVASPSLYALLENYEDNPEEIDKDGLESLQISLYKYYSRFSNRCTPFGLFAQVSAIGLGKNSQIQVDRTSIRKATKFDTFFLANLLQFIAKVREIRNALVYFPNTSLYQVSDRYRYVEYYFKEEVRLHKLSGVSSNVYLERITEAAAAGASIEQLAGQIEGNQVSREQAVNYLHTLIDNQFLVSELEINLTGEDYLSSLIATFSEARFKFFEAQEVLSLLLDLQKRLNKLEGELENVQPYLNLFEYVKEHFDAVPIKKLFQVDSYRNIDEGQLSYSVLKQLRSAVQVVNKLSAEKPETTLDQFAKQFTERYEEKELPLTQVLDPDIGINYAKALSAKTPLVEGLSLGSRRGGGSLPWGKPTSLLFRRLLAAYQNNELEIELTEKEVNKFDELDNRYYDTFSVFFNAFSENGDDKLHLKNIWGPSAAALIGRFCHLDEKVYDLADEILRKEDELYKDKIVAEVIHLPQARTGNVLHRKNQRQYEIPYLGKSSVAEEQQIAVSDLMVSVKNGKIVLRSASLDKEVIPRLSNAHNYRADALPIYHFLCDLQLRDSGVLNMSWGNLKYEYPYTPRVTFKNVVLLRAGWMLNPDDIKELTKKKGDQNHLPAFLERRKIPKVVAVTMGDNEVVVNFDNPLSRKVFYSLIKNKGLVELKEFFFQEPSITGNYANEFIVTALRKEKDNSPYILMPSGDYQDTRTTTNFSIGDEWLYYKFYCGDKTAETVLKEGILPAVKDLEAKSLISKWFFIRYMDKDGFHLRFRILLRDKSFFSHCINSIKYHVADLERKGFIWKTQVDTYQRETERYGYHSIETVESIFHHDSRSSLQFVNMIEGEAGERVRWLFSLLSMDAMLNDFHFNLEQKAAVMKMLKSSFGSEFNRKGLLNKQINELYEKEEQAIANFLNKEQTNQVFLPLWDIIEQRSAAYREHTVYEKLMALEKTKKLPLPFHFGIVPSFIHMVCNRIFLNKQRVHEMVVYDFLYKYYSKALHLSKQKQKEATKIKS